jgi:flagellar hook-length control protein FliK
MSVAASRPPAPVAAPAPVPTPTPADREPGPARFAELLRQSRGAERRPHAEATTAADGRASRSQATPDASASASATRTATAGDEAATIPDGSARSDAGRARARHGASASRAAAERSAGRSEGAAQCNAASAARDGTEEDETSSHDTPGPPATATPSHGPRPDPHAGDAELRFAAAGRHVAANGVRGGDGDTAALNDRAGEGGATEGASPTRRAGSEAAGRAESGRSAARPARDGGAQGPSASFAGILGDAQAGDRPNAAAAASRETASPLVGPTPMQDAAAPAAVESASAPQPATVAVPLDAPEFPAAFGVQVSVLVKDGVQQAELHLNPAETGPVSIAITLDGTQAHVEFGADLAATRQAIENGLPALASALRDAGFTLAGGGVAQHSRSGAGRDDNGPSPDDRGSRRASRSVDAIAPATPQRSSHRINAGGIDLYA